MTNNIRPLYRAIEYVKEHQDRLDLLWKMWTDPRVQCYNDSALPSRRDLLDFGSVFLIGPTSWHQILECNWRCEAVAYLREAGFNGFIFVPESRGLEKEGDFPSRSYIRYWESDRLFGRTMRTGASRKSVWIPRDAVELLGLNTNLEFGITLGMLAAGRKVNLFVGWPDEAERIGLPDHYSVILQKVKRYDTLRRLCYAIVNKIPPEDVRVEYEYDDVPF